MVAKWCLIEAFVKRWPTGKELEKPDTPWLSADEEILGSGKLENWSVYTVQNKILHNGSLRRHAHHQPYKI